jgi:S1-C subfamily serine protease
MRTATVFHVVMWVTAILLVVWGGSPPGAAQDRLLELFQLPEMPDDGDLTSRASQLSALLQPPTVEEAWQPAANDEQTRGPAQAVYPKVAPAVVVVRTGTGHGTGFVIDPAGWIVTNHHVIENGQIDPATQARRVTVYFGRLQDGWMTLIEKGVPADVYKTNKDKDLALLKLREMPEGIETLSAVEIADKLPPPGSVCVAIGHPAAGLLWTVRSGEVGGFGQWPGEMIDVVMERLTLADRDRERLDRMLKDTPQRKVVISTCGLNPGDSGGPLVDGDGRLIAVSFAIPRSPENEGIRLDKFSYHVHLDEFKDFVAQRPEQPEIEAPDPWPPAAYHALVDADGDGIPDTLLCFVDKNSHPTGILIDLDQDSAKNLIGKKPREGSLEDAWDFEFALHRVPHPRAFYDTNNDGTIDLVLIDADGDGKVDSELVLKDGRWTSQKPRSTKLIDPTRFEDPELGKRLVAVTS